MQPSLAASSLVFVLLLAASTGFFLGPLRVSSALAGAIFLWFLSRHPLPALGIVLAFLPFDYLAIELGKFFAVPHMSLVSACTKEIPLLLLIVRLAWRKAGPWAFPDYFLLAFFATAATSTVLQGNLAGLATDVNFLIPYTAGRVAVLSDRRQQIWAGRAVWIAGLLSLLGLIEVFLLGEAPRTLLYLATGGETFGESLPASFHGMGFNGLREAATMVGPPDFAALCMVALILWWVYGQSLWPGVMVAVGLVCSVTRSAWLGATCSILLLGILTGQRKRLARCAAFGLGLFLLAIPALGLGDYLFATRTGEDLSEQSHRDSLLHGIQYMAEHPLGGGNFKVGPRPAERNSAAVLVESTYLDLGSEYGIAGFLFFLGFIICALHWSWRQSSQLGYASLGILVGMGMVMTVLNLHDDRRLAGWVWFPVGLAVQAWSRRAVLPVPASKCLFPKNQHN
jgi:hypothetical protein